jgi:hypothetical protein
MTPVELVTAGDKLFSKRSNLMDLWQELYEHFLPWQADFTTALDLGEDYAADLVTSYPILVARDLSDTFGAMLRPADREWAIMEVEGLDDWEGKAWLERATKAQRKAMYDKPAQFLASVKAGDRDFAVAGQCVLSVELMPNRASLLYRQWHLRDTVWSDALNGEVNCVHRKWKPTAYDLAQTFGEARLHEKVRDQLRPGKDPYCDINVRHIVMPASLYHGQVKYRTPFVSIYVDVDNAHVIEERGLRINPYVIPRWQKVGQSQYAVSPAAVAALPEARLLQAMTFTLLEAGEKAVNPALIATKDAISGGLDLRSGGVTYVLEDYDERKGEVLRPLHTVGPGMPLGLELQNRSETMLKMAFYADKLALPQRGGPQETAYEVGQRVQEYVRNALPLFEPVETSYNGGLCEKTFVTLADAGAFGPPETWPESLRGRDINFRFVSPLRDAHEGRLGNTLQEASAILGQAMAVDPSVVHVIDAPEAVRQALEGIGVPTKWTRSREAVAARVQHEQQAMQAQQLLGTMQQASEVARNLKAA